MAGAPAQSTPGSVGVPDVSREAKKHNTPPEIKWIRFVLGDGGQANSIGVETGTFDADGDSVRVDVEWRKNGEPAGTGNRLGVPVKRGDRIDVTVIPRDGDAQGKIATLHREIRNSAPVVEGQEQFNADGNHVTFRVKASDPDGDKLSFAVKDAPAGMKIDRETGWVRWETAPGETGKVPFTVTVSDGSGGEATARFNVTIAEQPPSRGR
ncbi:MAG: cadherin-like domain-containing protein [Deltaproteobacteria bacterium]|nr:cadherin-like domain-containing protein [Deltaproteobacteria bacterium]